MIDYRVGDVREVMATIPDGSVSLIASSPPFFKLRSYLPGEHESKHAEIGSETTPAEFLDTLLELTAEWGRVLAPWGSLAIELGDTYAGSGGAGEITSREHRAERDGTKYKFDRSSGRRAPGGQPYADMFGKAQPGGDGYPRPKCLVLIPELYAIALAYGINPLTGKPSPAGQWLVRNIITWHRPNPAVGALGDKVRPSTSYITVATRSPKRWFDLDAVRATPTATEVAKLGQASGESFQGGDGGYAHGRVRTLAPGGAGAPPLDCWFDQHDTWTITTQPSSLAHYAMWPAKLAERLILMMCPAEVCAVCQEPRRRLTAPSDKYAAQLAAHRELHADKRNGSNATNPARQQFGIKAKGSGDPTNGQNTVVDRQTIGWSDCGHDAYVSGTVLDPFAGTGTTLAVADLHGRDAIGIDLDERNRDLYERRRDECARALFDVRPQMQGQMGLFGEAS